MLSEVATEEKTGSLEDALWAGVAEAKAAAAAGDSETALVQHAVAVALAETASERAAALASLAGTLRRLERPEHALTVARASERVAPNPTAKVVALTCVCAALCDLHRDEEDRAVGELGRTLMPQEPKLLNALGRAYVLGFQATGLIEFRDAAEECFAARSGVGVAAN